MSLQPGLQRGVIVKVLCAAGVAYAALSFTQHRSAAPEQHERLSAAPEQHERLPAAPADVVAALDKEAQASTGTYWGLAPPPAVEPQERPK